MKRLVGGDYLLDLSPIEIEESVDGETYTNITDKSVLDQLTGLKAFIGKSGMIKPIWVKLLNGETDEIVATRGSLSTSDGTTFLIKILLTGFILTLSVEFTQAVDEDSNPLDEWYIDDNDAKYILVSDAQSLAQQLADFEGDVSIDGDVSVSGDLELGETSEAKIFENIVDAQGHKRFIEGDGTPSAKEGVTTSYCKWSLSGTHLMMVTCVTVANDTVLNAADSFGYYALPEWILDKIIPVFATNYIEVRSAQLRDDSWTSQNVTVGLYKGPSGISIIVTGSGLTLTSNKTMRLQFDLLIDNETPAP